MTISTVLVRRRKAAFYTLFIRINMWIFILFSYLRLRSNMYFQSMGNEQNTYDSLTNNENIFTENIVLKLYKLLKFPLSNISQSEIKFVTIESSHMIESTLINTQLCDFNDCVFIYDAY